MFKTNNATRLRRSTLFAQNLGVMLNKESMQNYSWFYDQTDISWNQLSDLYRIAPLGDKKPEDLEVVFSNSKFKCFVYNNFKLIGVGRALADGIDCSYIPPVSE